MKIDRFAEAWRGVQSGSALQKQQNLEDALRLDGQISGGHFAPQIRPKLRDSYSDAAQRAWQSGQYASACQSAMRALKLDRAASGAAAVQANCESKAREYYDEGKRLEATDLRTAQSYWRKVISMVPSSSTWYSKAYTAVNNSGRGRQLDEDE